jgi:hypothetical protein
MPSIRDGDRDLRRRALTFVTTVASCAAVIFVAAAISVLMCAGASASTTSPSSRLADSAPGIPGLPSGVPAAATAPEPALPQPSNAEWPFPNDFSHTSGTGRISGGASLWTDFLYDDHGPLGSPVGIAKNALVSDLAPVHGGFVYPEGPAENDGADIFTAAVGYTPEATYWRVDWNTLANADVPIAEWTFSSGAAEPASTETWPGNAGVRSAGIQYALIVSAQHAQLIEAASGDPVAGADLSTDVNTAAKSFVVRIPTSVLPVSGEWRVRLAAGLANAGGTAFETVQASDGGTGLPGAVNVYNVTFRGYRQETPVLCPTSALPLADDSSLLSELETQLGGGSGEEDHVPVVECSNFWMESGQANALATGDVSQYSLPIDWSQLQAQDETPEPQPSGYSNRWYVSPLQLGEGVIDAEGTNTYTGPTYLGRVQPYAVYVPSDYDPSTPTRLTWILHSLGSNLNQYGGLAPSQISEECEERHSICATTEGFSDGQWYYGAAQVDFWDVWHQLASDYDLSPDETAMSGYSMGGFASYKLVEEYPDLFAEAMPLEGPVICGDRVAGSIESAAGGEECTNDGNTTPLIGNLEWVPYVMTYGGADELVPITGGLEQVHAFDALGYRYHAVIYPTEDHLVFATQNDFSPPISQLGEPQRVLDPASFDFEWYPNVDSSSLGIGPTRDYWVSGLAAANAAPGEVASVDASSQALPEPSETIERQDGTADGPTPAVTESLTWTPGSAPPLEQSLELTLSNVSALSLEAEGAGLTCATVTVRSGGPAMLTLLQLRPESEVLEGGASVATTDAQGSATVALSAGTTALGLCSTAASAGESPPDGRIAGGNAPGSAEPAGGVARHGVASYQTCRRAKLKVKLPRLRHGRVVEVHERVDGRLRRIVKGRRLRSVAVPILSGTKTRERVVLILRVREGHRTRRRTIKRSYSLLCGAQRSTAKPKRKQADVHGGARKRMGEPGGRRVQVGAAREGKRMQAKAIR